jgi:hypothetical protein
VVAKDVEAERLMGTEEAVARLIQELIKVSEEKSKVLSDLNDEEVGVLSLLSTIGEKLNISALKSFCLNFAQYRVSRFRLGRREMVNIASYSTGLEPERRKVRSLKDLFSGIR